MELLSLDSLWEMNITTYSFFQSLLKRFELNYSVFNILHGNHWIQIILWSDWKPSEARFRDKPESWTQQTSVFQVPVSDMRKTHRPICIQNTDSRRYKGRGFTSLNVLHPQVKLCGPVPLEFIYFLKMQVWTPKLAPFTSHQRPEPPPMMISVYYRSMFPKLGSWVGQQLLPLSKVCWLLLASTTLSVNRSNV